jgi:hypothetical protein
LKFHLPPHQTRGEGREDGDVPTWQICGARLSSELRGGVDQLDKYDGDAKMIHSISSEPFRGTEKSHFN